MAGLGDFIHAAIIREAFHSPRTQPGFGESLGVMLLALLNRASRSVTSTLITAMGEISVNIGVEFIREMAGTIRVPGGEVKFVKKHSLRRSRFAMPQRLDI